jgi:hypothetical protein
MTRREGGGGGGGGGVEVGGANARFPRTFGGGFLVVKLGCGYQYTNCQIFILVEFCFRIELTF